MRNLKRALSLALAAIMVIGMMVVGTGAAFSDNESIKNTEAVDVVSVLGIIKGLPDGSYGPDQMVDRASMAKMITLALNGGVEPILGVKDKATYTDIKGTWAEQFIEYCSSMGIIAGDGAGKFNPTGTVTGSQAAKMLLVALGYDATVFGFTGSAWEINVNREANSAGLYNGLAGLQASAPLSRDNAAQMIFNALNAYVMEKTPGLDLTTGGISYTYKLSTKTMLEVEFGAVRLTGIVTGNEYADLTGTTPLSAGKTAITLDTNNTGLTGNVFNVATGADVLGKSVSLFVKVDSTKTASKSTIIGTPSVNGNNRVVTLNAEKTATGMTNFTSDNKLTLDSNTKYSYNFSTASNSNSAMVTTNAAGVELTFIDNNNDNKVEYVIQLAKTFGEVTNYNNSGKGSISVTAFNRNAANAPLATMSDTNAKEDVVGFADVAKNDYVMFYNVAGVKHVEKVTPVEATITNIRGDKIIADGVTYAQSGLVTGVDANNAVLATAVNNSLQKIVKLFLDDAGNVLRVADADSTVRYLFVENVDTYSNVSNAANTKIVLSDGTSSVVKAYVTDGTTKSTPVAATVYTYGVNNDGSYELRAIDTGKYTANNAITAITKGDVTMTGAPSGTVANANTVFVVKNGNTYTTYKGISNVPSQTISNAYGVYKNSNDVFEVVFITVSNITGSAKSIYAITGSPDIKKDGDKTIYTYDVVYEGKYQQLTGSNAAIFGDGAGLYNGVSVNGSEITAAGTYGTQGAKATRNSNGLIANSATVYTYDEKTIFLTIDMDGENGDEMVVAGDIGSVIIDSVNTSNTSTIIIVPGSASANRTTVADYVYILK